jgi:outer membrane beta-barrel protein
VCALGLLAFASGAGAARTEARDDVAPAAEPAGEPPAPDSAAAPAPDSLEAPEPAAADSAPAPPDSAFASAPDSALALPVDSTFYLPRDSASVAAALAHDSLKAAAARTSQPTIYPTIKVRLHASDHNVVRTGPGDRYAIVGVYAKGEVFPVIAKSGDWYNIRVSDIATGWIHSSLCEEFEDLSYLEYRPNPKLYSRTGSFVLGAWAGGYAFDRKSNSLTIGGRLDYYLFDRLQAEVGLGWTHVTRPAEIVESLFGLTLEAEDFHMLFYDLNLLLELLPGRQMVPYVVGGAGSSIMQGRSEVSYNFGAGTLLFLSKKAAMRWEVRGYNFTSGPDNVRHTNNNIAFTLGTSFLL